MDYDDNPLETIEQREARLKKAETERVNRLVEIDDLKWLMGHKQGRRIVWRLLEQYGVFRSSFTDNPYVTAFNEGNRNGGLKLMADIHEHAPERYAAMIEEHKHARSSNSSGSAGGDKPDGSSGSGGDTRDE